MILLQITGALVIAFIVFVALTICSIEDINIEDLDLDSDEEEF